MKLSLSSLVFGLSTSLWPMHMANITNAYITGERPHQCKLCNKAFYAASALKVHMRVHTGDKPYPCSICGKHFRQYGDLKYHTTSVHSEERLVALWRCLLERVLIQMMTLCHRSSQVIVLMELTACFLLLHESISVYVL